MRTSTLARSGSSSRISSAGTALTPGLPIPPAPPTAGPLPLSFAPLRALRASVVSPVGVPVIDGT
jgi:hypothetical protein